ncbi:FkbM family methyltransferase [Oceanimonas smirnovii]|uniref:FkbM family methyltransferase n=1 Tax=Oceanimonas smirnovii TaxID=264574 RepID=UPI000365FD0D|nr:FkbM family methyltransferase [Oceanimonas smirnovii]
MNSKDRLVEVEQLSIIQKLVQKGLYSEAKKEAKSLLEKRPNNQEILLILAKINYHQGNNFESISNLKSLLKENPAHEEGNYLLARLYFDIGNNELALKYIENGDSGEKKTPPSELKGIIQAAAHHYEESVNTFLAIIEAKSESWNTWNNLGNQYRNLGDFENAKRCYLEAIKLSGNNDAPFNNLLTFSHYLPETKREDIKSLYESWEERYAKDISKKVHTPEIKTKSKTIRIGMVSDGFRNHPVGQMITSALDSLPSHEIELFTYSTNQHEDHITQKIIKASKKWSTATHQSDENLAEEIASDQIDILFDLCGHNNGFRIRTMLMKPAPILVKWVGGLINTTGLSTMDYLLSDSIETPVGEDKFYTEKLIRMPDDYICYNPPIYTPDIHSPPARRDGHITLGCFNNPTKINPVLLGEWAKIMYSLPKSKLFLKGYQFSSETFREKIKKQLNNLGVSEKRIIIEGPSSHEELLNSYRKVDIALDTWPYSGGLTTCEAMYMGVPVVTYPGPTFAGRHSATHLTNAGMPQLVAESWEHYHDLVVMLASDIDNLANIRTHMRSALLESPVCDAKRFARNFSNAMRAIWQRYCEGKQPAALTLDKNGNAQFEDEAEPVQLQLPEEPVLVKDDDFHFRFNGKIVVVDHGAGFACSESFHTLHKLGAIRTICIDPGSRINNSQQLANTGDFHHFPMTVLGDGSQKTLCVTLKPAHTRSLPFVQTESFPEELRNGYELLAQLPVNTLRLDDVEGLEAIDLLVIDNNHDTLTILANSTKKLANTLIVKVKVNFNFIHNKECDFSAISSVLMEHGFIFHDFINKMYVKSSNDIASPDLLFNADAIFLPSKSKLAKSSDNSILKLAFLYHHHLDSPELCTRTLHLADSKLAEQYKRKNNIFVASEENKENLNINTKNKITRSNSGDFNWDIEELISVVDIGANPIDGEPPYFNLLRDKKVKVTGFEPQNDALEKLIQMKSENETYLPYAVGDGNEATLYICNASGMTSTLKPNFEVLNQFQGYPQWAKIKKEEKIKTVRLDDLSDLTEIDWLKIDIQGGELSVFKNSENKLENTLVIQTEVNFIQLYENQPLFAEIDQWMREHGFILHTLLEERKRLYAPLVINNQIHNGINQLTTADAIYIKSGKSIEKMTTTQKKKMAYILHHAYGSYDISLRILLSIPSFDKGGYIKSLTLKDNIESKETSK